MESSFSKLFWGLLIVIFDFAINGFDLLPDGIGYLLVAWGCQGLISGSSQFKLAQMLSIALCVLWAVGFLIDGSLSTPFGIVVVVINCLMIWYLLGGIVELAEARQNADLASKANHRRIIYTALMVVIQIISLTGLGRDLGPAIALVLVVTMLVLLAMILHVIHRGKMELARG